MLKSSTNSQNRIFLICQEDDFSLLLNDGIKSFGLSVAGASDDIDTAMWEVSVLKPCIVVMDYDNNGISCFDLMQRIRREIDKNILFVLITDTNDNSVIDTAYLSGFSFCMLRPCEMSILSEKLFELAQIYAQRSHLITSVQESSLRVDIEEVLQKIGIPKRCSGYGYLATALHLVINDFSYIGSFMNRLYPDVASIHSTRPECVERNIRTAIDAAWDRGNTDYLSEIISCAITSPRGVPTNSMFISILAEYIRTEE